MLRHALGILLLCGFRVTGERTSFFLIAKESSDRGAIELQNGTTTKTLNLNALWILNHTYVKRPTVWTSQHGPSYVYFTAVHFESRTNCVARALIENLDIYRLVVEESPLICSSNTLQIDEASIFNSDAGQTHLLLKSGPNIWVSNLERDGYSFAEERPESNISPHLLNATSSSNQHLIYTTHLRLTSAAIGRRDSLLYLFVAECENDNVTCALKYVVGSSQYPLKPFVDDLGRSLSNASPSHLNNDIFPNAESLAVSMWGRGENAHSELIISYKINGRMVLRSLNFDGSDRPSLGLPLRDLVTISDVDVDYFNWESSLSIMAPLSSFEQLKMLRGCWLLGIDCDDTNKGLLGQPRNLGVALEEFRETEHLDNSSNGKLVEESKIYEQGSIDHPIEDNEVQLIPNVSNEKDELSPLQIQATSTEKIATAYTVEEHYAPLVELEDGSSYPDIRKFHCTRYDPVKNARVICHIPDSQGPTHWRRERNAG